MNPIKVEEAAPAETSEVDASTQAVQQQIHLWTVTIAMNEPDGRRVSLTIEREQATSWLGAVMQVCQRHGVDLTKLAGAAAQVMGTVQ